MLLPVQFVKEVFPQTGKKIKQEQYRLDDDIALWLFNSCILNHSQQLFY